ncbi:hypothetical protein HWV62_45306 [Athelia sp. TMB]|nr:hypothetical protein HWV62_45306 [Athelia sp. TMB]
MNTRNIKQRRPVVAATAKIKRAAVEPDVQAEGNIDEVQPVVTCVYLLALVSPLTLFFDSKKRNQARAITPETEGSTPSSLLQSPTKTRVKPSERSVAITSPASVFNRDGVTAASAGAAGDIVFTDDEDFVSVSVAPKDGDDDDSGVEDDDMPPLRDVTPSEDSASDGGSEFQDVGHQVDEDVVDNGYELVVDPVEVLDKPRARRADVAVGSKRRTKVDETLDKMETERDMYVQARKQSVASIASTNPGDGTKRLYGEESYIHDDIQNPPIGPRPKPRSIVPLVTTKARQQRVARTNVNSGRTVSYVDTSGNMVPRPVAPVTPTKSRPNKVVPVNDDDEDGMVLLSDTEPRGRRRVDVFDSEECPAECEVSNQDDMDDIIDYSNLPNLIGGKRLLSWSQLPGPGLAVPSAWHDENPAISMSTCIQFRESEWFCNPSRMTPSRMGLSPFPGNSYIVVGGTTKAATMTTAILVTSSNIHRMKEVFGEDRRMIAGIPHITEFQRMEAGILMALRLETAHAQMSQQSITFSTSRTMGTGGSSPAKNPSRMFRQPAGASASRGSPFASAMSNIQGAGYVPVLDARHCRFSVKNLVGLDKVLPTFDAEVPEGSLAWVGYTVNKYSTTRGNHVNFNLLWVVVLGTPE